VLRDLKVIRDDLQAEIVKTNEGAQVAHQMRIEGLG